MILLGVGLYLAVGGILLLGGAFKHALKMAIKLPFEIEILVVAGKSKVIVALKIVVYRLIIYSVQILFWPAMIVVELSLRRESTRSVMEQEPTIEFTRRFNATRENLVRRYTIEEAELENCAFDPTGRVPNVPFGFISSNWRDLKSTMQPDDELWYFSTDSETWAKLCGRSGFAVVRSGLIVSEMLCSMN